MIKTLTAIALAGAFALPTVAQASAADDNLVIAQAGGGAGGGDAGAAGRANPSGPTMGAAGASAGTTFDSLDRNHDGFISRDEANATTQLNTRFSELDRNNDGKLSREEYNALNDSASGATGARSPGSMGR